MSFMCSIVDMSGEALASQCAQHCSDERNFTDSSEMCSGVVILLALVVAHERQDNRPRPQYLSMYDWLINFPSTITIAVAFGF